MCLFPVFQRFNVQRSTDLQSSAAMLPLVLFLVWSSLMHLACPYQALPVMGLCGTSQPNISKAFPSALRMLTSFQCDGPHARWLHQDPPSQAKQHADLALACPEEQEFVALPMITIDTVIPVALTVLVHSTFLEQGWLQAHRSSLVPLRRTVECYPHTSSGLTGIILPCPGIA